MLFSTHIHDLLERPQPQASADGRKRPLSEKTAAYRVIGGDQGGSWSLIEYTAPPRSVGPSPHAHAQLDEAYFVLEGRPVFQVGEHIIHARPDLLVVVERGTVHSFMNPEAEPARFLVLLSPAGYEGFWLGEGDRKSVV